MNTIACEVSSSNLFKQPPDPARPRVGITMGDPAGIGSEVVLKSVAEREVLQVCRPVIIGDAQHLAHTARTLGLACGYDVVLGGEQIPEEIQYPVIYNLRNAPGSIEPGVESATAGRAAAEYIETSVRLCSSGEIDAIATAPINKRSLFLAGYNFPGHTEFYAHLTRASEFAMAFVAGDLRIILLSTHVPLIDAIQMVKRERLV
ncbi:MAG: PdxA family dehydrogenase, partial [Pyrinomonadaceae bacterium]